METDPRSSTNAAKPRGLRLWRKRDEELEPAEPPERDSLLFGPSARPLALTTAADIPGLFGGVLSTATLAGRVGTAARCLQLVAQQIAAAPLRYRREIPAPAGKSYAPPWISSPDPAWYPNGIRDAIFSSVWSIYAQGDAFLWTTSRSADGYPATWTVLDPAQMVVKSANGSRTYDYANVPLDPRDVLQISRNPNGSLRGTSALSAYYSNLLAAFQGDDYAGAILSGGGVPSAVLKSARRLTADQAADVKTQWITRTAGAGPAVLPPDLDFEQLAFSPKDLTLLETREWDAKQIAAAFGVPAPLLNMTLAGGLTYQNPSALFDLWWRSELDPVGKSIESALATWLPRGSWVEFDSSSARSPDFATLSATWISLVAAKIATPDEARAAVLDLPPQTQGEQIALIDEPAGSGTSIGSAPAVPITEPTSSPTLEVVQ
jgi:HK97 family phage portal protein